MERDEKQEQANPKRQGKQQIETNTGSKTGLAPNRGQFVFFASLGGAFLFPYSAACFLHIFCEKVRFVFCGSLLIDVTVIAFCSNVQ